MTPTVEAAVNRRLSGLTARLGGEERTFECCDTRFTVVVDGRGASRAARRAERTARALEAQLDAFDEASAVSELNREGRVSNPHVAAIVRRGFEYADRTDGVFAITNGETEHALKAYLRGEVDSRPESTPRRDRPGTVRVRGDAVETDVPLDLNGLAKGYVVDRAAEALAGFARRGFVNGGGDVSRPTGPVGIESPYGESRPLKVVATDWNVATSGGYRRRRADLDHIYDARAGRVGASHELVTVVATRDCMEADALATTLAALSLEEALSLAERWDGVEALVVHDGVLHETEGFGDHVA